MDDIVYKRVRALAIAGWWTALIATIWGTVVWLTWLVLARAEPAWVLSLWGGGNLTWSEVRSLVLMFFGVMKLMLWAWVMATICVSIWARRLKRIA